MTDTHIDCAIVGAGILGLSISAAIKERHPTLRLALFEKSLVASGASRYSVGMHYPYGGSEWTRMLSRESEDVYKRWKAADPRIPISSLKGYGIGHHDLIKERMTGPYEVLSSEIGTSLGRFSAGSGQVAITFDGAHVAHVAGLAEILASKLRQAGIPIYEGTTVTKIEAVGDKEVLRLSCGRGVFANRIIIVPGPWACQDPFSGLTESFSMRVKKVASFHIASAPTIDDGLLVLFDEDAFLLPDHRRGQWIFCYTSNTWDIVPDTKIALLEEDLTTAQNILRTYAPQLAEHLDGGRAFCDAYAADRRAVVSRVPGRPDIIFAGGAHGSGYRLAPAISRIVSEIFVPTTPNGGA